MCFDPMTIGALALSAGGALAQNQAQAAARRATEEGIAAANAAETERQNRYERESRALWDKSHESATREEQDTKLGDAVAKRRSLYEGTVKAPAPETDLLSGQGSAPSAVRDFIVGKMNDGATASRAEGARKAALDAWGDLQLKNAAGNQRAADNIGMYGGFSRASASILPLEFAQARANGAAKARSPLGDLLTGAGMLTGFAGAAGYGPQTWGSLFQGPAAGASTTVGASSGQGMKEMRNLSFAS